MKSLFVRIFVLFVCGLSFSKVAIAQVQTHLAVCPYDTSTLVKKTGVVTSITGDGIMLEDGTDVVLPESLLPYARFSKTFSILGLPGHDKNKFWALVVDLGLDKEGKSRGMACVAFGSALKGAYAGTDSYDMIKGGVVSTPNPPEEDD